MNRTRPVLVIGCGLIGTSLALALTEQGRRVHLVDTVTSNLELAVSRGAGSPEPVADPELIVVAVPPSVVSAVVVDALRRYRDAVVTDVTSVKSELVSAVVDSGYGSRFVGGHPMAGKERSGPMAAVAQLFEGRPWAIVPTPMTEESATDLVTEVAQSVGAVARRMDAATHDRAVALVSHVPHLASVAVAGLLNEAPDGALDLAGPGLRDVTRVAGSQTGLWVDILGGNAAEVRRLLGLLRDSIDQAMESLDADPAALSRLLDAGRAGATAIPGRHGGTIEPLTVVYVSVDDRPGELSRLMADTGESEVDIKDVRIDHELDRPAGQVELSVLETSADQLVDTLAARGWSVHR